MSLKPSHSGETDRGGSEQAAEAWKILGPDYEAGLQLEERSKDRQVLAGSIATNPGWGSLSSWHGKASPWVKC